MKNVRDHRSLDSYSYICTSCCKYRDKILRQGKTIASPESLKNIELFRLTILATGTSVIGFPIIVIFINETGKASLPCRHVFRVIKIQVSSV